MTEPGLDRLGGPALAHRLLERTMWLRGCHPWTRATWQRAYDLAVGVWGDEDILTTLHGHRATINFANPYPFYAGEFRNYNAPQVEIIALTSHALDRKVHVVDVGAAIGDTALLIIERSSRYLAALDCVEGEDRFYRTLEHNLEGTIAKTHHAILSDRIEKIGSLVRSQHVGTASAHGPTEVEATTLDRILGAAAPDVIKVDTDGYDGKVIGGAKSLLSKSRPSVIFEWHPRICRATGTDDSQAFSVLKGLGYTRFVFFTKYGEFSHFGDDHLGQLRELCLSATTLADWHYDVVALHGESRVDEVELADLRNWAREHP